MMSGVLNFDNLLIDTGATGIDHAHHPAVSVHVFQNHPDLLAEYHTRCKLFGPVAKILASLRSVDAIKSDLVLSTILENDDGVTICSGTFDLYDLFLDLEIIQGRTLNPKVYPEADVNGDGRIGVAEAVYILRILKP